VFKGQLGGSEGQLVGVRANQEIEGQLGGWVFG